MIKVKIEIRSRNIKNLPGNIQHLFIIYTDSVGKEWIIRGGPDGSFVTGDMEFDVMLPYGERVNDGKESIDWVKREEGSIIPSIILTAGMSEEEIIAAVDRMVSRAEYLHSLRLDYKTATLHAVPVLDEFANHVSKAGLPFFADILHLQNSNTFVRDVIEYAGLKFELPMCGDEVCNAPGWQHEFRNTKYDKVTKKLIGNYDNDELSDSEITEVVFAYAFSMVSIYMTMDWGSAVIRRSEVYRKLRDAARDAIKKLTGRGDDDDKGNGGGSGTEGSGASDMERAFEEAIVREESREEDAERTREEREMYEEQLRIWILKMEEKRLKDLMEQKLAEYIKFQEKEMKITQEAKVAMEAELKKLEEETLKEYAKMKDETHKRVTATMQAANEQAYAKYNKELQDKLNEFLNQQNIKLQNMNKASQERLVRENSGEIKNGQIHFLNANSKNLYESRYKAETEQNLKILTDEYNKFAEDFKAQKMNEIKAQVSANTKRFQTAFESEVEQHDESIQLEFKRLVGEIKNKYGTPVQRSARMMEDELNMAKFGGSNFVRQELNILNNKLNSFSSLSLESLYRDNMRASGWQNTHSSFSSGSCNGFETNIPLFDLGVQFTNAGQARQYRNEIFGRRDILGGNKFGEEGVRFGDKAKSGGSSYAQGMWDSVSNFGRDLWGKLGNFYASYTTTIPKMIRESVYVPSKGWFDVTVDTITKTVTARSTHFGVLTFTAAAGVLLSIGTAAGMLASAPISALALGSIATLALMESIKGHLAYATTHVSPIVLDLNGDGVKLYNYKSGVYFDYYNDKFAVKTGWISEDDGFLARDLNGNGKIDSIAELFGNDVIPAFFKLSLLDINNDGVIDSKDAIFDQLLIWQDKNRNGISESEEIHDLKYHGIASIGLERIKVNEKVGTEGDGQKVYGNIIVERSYFTYNDGRKLEAVDVLFENDPMDSFYLGDPITEQYIVATEGVTDLPNMHGFGKLAELWIAMTKNSALKGAVSKVVNLSPDGLKSLNDDIENILYIWADSDKFSEDTFRTADGVNISGKKVGVIEKFTGEEFRQLGVAKFVGQHASVALNKAFLKITHELSIHILVQGTFKSLFPNALYDPILHKLELKSSFAEILEKVKKYAQDYTLQKEFWVPLAQILIAKQKELKENATSIVSKLESIAGHKIWVANDSFELIGTDSDDVMEGTDAGDIIKGLGGNDKLYGLGGDDHIEGGEGDDKIYGGSGKDRIWGGPGSDIIFGENGRDFIYGDEGDDTIDGGDDDDIIEGGPGGDNMNGGAGKNTLSYGSSQEGVHINLQTSHASGGDADGDKFVNFLNIGGSESDDHLIGDDKDNHINGEGGNDVIKGGKGNDHLFGAKGSDRLYGEEGDDFLVAFDGPDHMDGGPGEDTVSYNHPYAKIGVEVNLVIGKGKGGHAEGDTYVSIENVIGSKHNDNIIGDDNNNSLDGADGNDVIIGGNGDDVISGGKGFNKLYGGAGNDVFLLGLGEDEVYGGEGRDTVSYRQAESGVCIDLSMKEGKAVFYRTDKFYSIENAIGSKFDDIIIGDDNNNILYGLGGADQIDGGKGVDTASYYHSKEGVYINLKTNENKGGDAEGDKLTNIENIVGSKFDDTIIGNDYNNMISGSGGGDQIDGGGGMDTVSYYNSDEGVNVNLLTNQNKGGDAEGDRLISIENIIGSEFDDTISGDDYGNKIDGGDGNDVIKGGKGNDIINGGNGKNILEGEEGNDTFMVEDGDNIINGGSGIDTIDYSMYRYDEYKQIIKETQLRKSKTAVGTRPGELPTDVIINDKDGIIANLALKYAEKGKIGKDLVSEVENVTGSFFNDVIIGDEKNNVLNGLEGDDEIRGGGGDDIIISAFGDSKLYGDGGNDKFIVNYGNKFIDGGDGANTIVYEVDCGIYVDLQNASVVKDSYVDTVINVDHILCTTKSDVIYDNKNNNVIDANDGNDKIYLTDGDDIVNGGEGNDSIYVAGYGNKKLYGGQGGDTFVFKNTFSSDGSNQKLGVIIYDFEIYNANEKIIFDGFGTSMTIGDLNISQIYENDLWYTVISISQNQKISLHNINESDLSHDNFIFV